MIESVLNGHEKAQELTKMKTAEKKMTPDLRFPEFSGEWQEKRLGDIAVGGFSNGVFNDPEKVGTGYRLINVKDMYQGSFVDTDSLTRVEISSDEFLKNKVESGDIFFTRSSLVKEGIAASNVCLSDAEDITFDGHVIRMRPCKTQIVPLCLSYCLRSGSIRRQLVARGKTTTMTTIGQDDIASVFIAFSSLAEQRKIAGFLSSIDRRIEGLEKKRELLKRYKKGLMQKLFNQSLRFENGNQPFPEWTEMKFSAIAERAKEKFDPTSGENCPCIELECLSQETGMLLKTFRSADQKSLKTRFVSGDVLFGKLRPYLKKFLRVPFDGVCSSEIWVLRGISVSNNFLYYLIQTDRFSAEVNSTTGSKMPRAEWKYIAGVKFDVPCLEEQRKIADCLSALDRKIEQVETQVARTREFKKGLLQKMFV